MATTKKYVSLDKLSLYDEKIKKVITDGDAAALASAKTYAEGLGVNYDSAGSAAAVQSNLDTEVSRAKAAEEANAALANAAQADVDALETYVGTIPEGATSTNVVAYVQERTANIATSDTLQGLTDRVGAVEGEVDAIQADYLKAADKTELQGNITTNADAIAAIKEDVDAFFADADMTESAKDTLKELQEYIASDETGAAAMAASIKQNSDDIDAVEGKVSTIEGNITDLQDEDTAIKGRLDSLQSAIGESGSVADDIATAKQEAIEAAAADATTKANTAESNAKTYADGLNTSMNTRVEALEAVDHSHANQTVLDGITEAKVTAWDAAEGNAKTYADGLNTAMDTRVTAVETGLTAFVEASDEDINGLFA